MVFFHSIPSHTISCNDLNLVCSASDLHSFGSLSRVQKLAAHVAELATNVAGLKGECFSMAQELVCLRGARVVSQISEAKKATITDTALVELSTSLYEVTVLLKDLCSGQKFLQQQVQKLQLDHGDTVVVHDPCLNIDSSSTSDGRDSSIVSIGSRDSTAAIDAADEQPRAASATSWAQQQSIPQQQDLPQTCPSSILRSSATGMLDAAVQDTASTSSTVTVCPCEGSSQPLQQEQLAMSQQQPTPTSPPHSQPSLHRRKSSATDTSINNLHVSQDVASSAHPVSQAPTQALVAAHRGESVSSSSVGVLEHYTVYVTSNDTNDLMLEINSSTTPTIFDLGGRIFHHPLATTDPAASRLLVKASSITIRNGTFDQPAGSGVNSLGLVVEGKDVRLEKLKLLKGKWGVLVLPGGSVHMIKCEVEGSLLGLGVGDFGAGDVAAVATLDACDTVVSSCGAKGLSIGRGGQAKLLRCDIKNSKHHGMSVSGDASSKLVATDVSCSGNGQRGLCVSLNGRALLMRCDLTGNSGGSVHVQNNGTARLLQCKLDDRIHTARGGTFTTC